MTTIHNHLLPLKLWTVEESNVMVKLKSKRTNKNPTPPAIRQNIGPKLADAVFSNICPVTKTLIGLGKELDGPGDELFSKPQRQLLGEIVLEQFPTRRHRQALTHQAILEYGGKCMEEWENNVIIQKELETKAKLKELEEEMNEIMETRINQVRAKEREDFLVRIAMMEEKLETRHRREMEALERKLTEERDAKIAEVIKNMNDNYQHETETLLDASKTLLTNRFHFKINWIKADLEEDYNNKLRSETKLIEMRLEKKLDSKKCANLKAMKNQMLQNVVCTACITADFLINEFQQKLDATKKELADLYACNINLVNEIEQLEKQNVSCSNQIKSWECVVRDIVKQFQKFIEFHLTLTHGESTHLISLEKVIEKKNEIFNKLSKVEKPLQPKLESVLEIPKSLDQQTDESSLKSVELCEYKEIASLISIIIRRVIPSLPDLAEAEREATNVLEDIIKQVLPSAPSIPMDFKTEQVSQTSDKKLCPIYQRSKRETKKSIQTTREENRSVTVDDSPQQLGLRVSEIIKIMDRNPHLMRFIQGT